MRALRMRALVARWRGRPPALAVSVLKGAVSITLCMALIFIRPFAELCAHPFALHSTIIVVVIGQAGKTVGACWETLILGGAGLACGAACFAILGELGKQGSPVGQGIVFAIAVYLAALVRHQGTRWVPFYLYSVLFAFQGIYNTIADNADEYRSWLLAYAQAYLWGIAIVLVVNLACWPVSSEGELRQLLTRSLNHVSTLAHLSFKTYAREISVDEKDVRDHLIETIRQDYSELTAKTQEASFEIVYTQWAMATFLEIAKKVQGLQQALITSSSALDLIDTLDPEGVNVKRLLLTKKETASTFVDFRQAIDIVILEITEALSGADPSQAPSPPLKPATSDIEASLPPVTRLETINTRLRQEVRQSSLRHLMSRAHVRAASFPTEDAAPSPTGDLDGVATLRRAWDRFSRVQSSAILVLIKDESLLVSDVLRIADGMPSLLSLYSERLPKAWTSTLTSAEPLSRLRSRPSFKGPTFSAPGSPQLEETEAFEDPSDESLCSLALTKTYSLLFGLGQLTDELCALHAVVKEPSSKRIRFHILDRQFKLFSWNRTDRMTLKEALAALRGVKYVSPPVPWVYRLWAVERWFRSDRSLYAMKVASGTTIYTVLLLAGGPRRFFVDYTLSSSLITVIVGISPSLGQSLRTFLLQLLGTGAGVIYGLIVLTIFHGVNGYDYNPYGLVASMAVWGLGTSYFFYKDPRWYSGSLLATNGAGSLLIEEYLSNALPALKAEGPYPSPALRGGQILAAMSISIAIAATFQLFLFRAPARRQLRLKIAAVTFSLSSYNTLLQSHINCVAPADDAPIPPDDALDKVQRELIKREITIQSEIIALGPLFLFAELEPNFATPFLGDVLLAIIKSHQIILDRLREARTAVGRSGFSTTVHHDFITTARSALHLYPYRLHSQRLARTLFYLGATSLQSKTPLPRDVPSSRRTWANFENDALVLSRRMSQLPDREDELHDPGFLRYWFYLVSIAAVSRELENLEGHLGELFGVPEETNPWIS